MNTQATRWLMIVGLAGVTACLPGNPGGGSGTGTGGSTAAGTGGSTTAGTGGSTTAGTGGRQGTGGTTQVGTGGSTTAGTGGSTTAGTGGSTTAGTGGASPSDAGVTTASFSYNFDTGLEGFSLNGYVPTGAGAQVNLAALEGGTPAVLAHDTTAGSPMPGSLKLTATFTDYKQFADVVIGPAAPGLNLVGKTIHAKVMLATGTFASGMGATLHAGTGASYVYGGGTYTSLMPGVWTDLTMDLSKPTAAGWDPSMVVQIGIQFYSGDPGEAGAFPGPVALVIQIDTITDGTGPVVTPALSYTFDTTVQGFAYNTYVPTGDMPDVNLAAPDASAPATLTWDSAEGNPAPGSLKVTATFSAYKQFVDVVIAPSVKNLMGKTIKAKVKLTSGIFGAGAGATLHAGTGASYTYGAGQYTELMSGAWTDLTLDLGMVTTAMFDPTMVVQLGIQLYSGSVPEAGGAFTGPNDVVINIDSITE